MRFWLDLGVDGFRLDAVPYLVERENTNNENLPETHRLLKHIRKTLEAHYPGVILLAEANQWQIRHGIISEQVTNATWRSTSR